MQGGQVHLPEQLHGLQDAAANTQTTAVTAAETSNAAGHELTQQLAEHFQQEPPKQELQELQQQQIQQQIQQQQEGHQETHQQQEPALQAEESLVELAESWETKRCAACRVVKPVSEYYRDRTHSRGIKTRCKECLRACKEAFKNQQRAKSAADQVTVTSKKCSHCLQEKAAAEFSRSSYQRTGLRSWCKECSSKSKKQAKAEGRWKSYDGKAKPRKCRKCEDIRQPEDFPLDPRNPSKRSRDCRFCLEASGMAAVAGEAGSHLAMGSWNSHLGEYWHMDPARAQQLQGMAVAEAYQQQQQQQQPAASESLMRILRAAMAGGGEEPRRMTPELLNQLGVYADPSDPFSELSPDAQAAVIQQFVDQQRQQAGAHPMQHPASHPPQHPIPHPAAHLLQAHPGFHPEVLYSREGIGPITFPPSHRPGESHLVQFATDGHQQDGRSSSQRPQEVPHEEKANEQPGQMSQFEQLRNVPYATISGEAWQQLQQQQQQQGQAPPHPHQHLLTSHDWPSAFAPTHRQMGSEPIQGSPKRPSDDS